MTAYKKWDLILVSFPFTDFSSDKRRPALIVSPDNFNSGPDVIIAFVTSQINSASKIGDCHLKKWKEAGLPKESMVRMKFASIDKTIIVKKLGEIEESDRTEIQNTLLSFFSS
jgi:mRNA interferase MazF